MARCQLSVCETSHPSKLTFWTNTSSLARQGDTKNLACTFSRCAPRLSRTETFRKSYISVEKKSHRVKNRVCAQFQTLTSGHPYNKRRLADATSLNCVNEPLRSNFGFCFWGFGSFFFSVCLSSRVYRSIVQFVLDEAKREIFFVLSLLLWRDNINCCNARDMRLDFLLIWSESKRTAHEMIRTRKVPLKMSPGAFSRFGTRHFSDYRSDSEFLVGRWILPRNKQLSYLKLERTFEKKNSVI